MPYQVDLKRPDLKGQFPCSVCQKIFCHSSSLSRHMMHAHFKSYVCKICNANIENNEILRAHMMEVHSITSKIVTCRCCNWAFSDKTTLRVHQQNLQQNKDSGEDVFVLATCTVDNSPKKKPRYSMLTRQLSPPHSTYSQNSSGSVKEDPSSDEYEASASPLASHYSHPNSPPQYNSQKALMELLVNANCAANVPTSSDPQNSGGVPMNAQQAVFANAMWMAQWMRNNAFAAQQMSTAQQARKRKAHTDLSVDTLLSDVAREGESSTVKRPRTDVAEANTKSGQGSPNSNKENRSGAITAVPRRTSKLTAIIDRLKSSSSSGEHSDANSTIPTASPLELTTHAEVKAEPTIKFESTTYEDKSDIGSSALEPDSFTATCTCLALINELEMDLDHVRSASTGATANIVDAAHTQVISDRLVLVRLEHAGHLAERALQLIPTSAPVGLYEAVANLIRITRPKTSPLAFSQ